MNGSEVWAIIFFIIGAVLVFLEFNLPTNFELFAFGVGFFSMSALTYLGVNLWIQILVFTLIVSSTIFLAYKFTKKTTQGVKDFSPFSIVGKEGSVVLVEGDKVIVRVEGEDWLAECEEELRVGDKVVVLEVLGNKIRIKRR